MRTTLPIFTEKVNAVEPVQAILHNTDRESERQITVQLKIASTLAYDLKLPAVCFDLSTAEGHCTRLLRTDAEVTSGPLVWNLSGSLTARRCPTLQTQLKAQSFQVPVILQSVGTCRTLAMLPYVASLLSGWRLNTTLVPPSEELSVRRAKIEV